MQKIMSASILAAALATGSALAADMKVKAPPPKQENPWDVAFGGAVMTDYNFRGISQSANRASVYSYFELRYNVHKDLQFYSAVSGYSIGFPNRAVAEIDLYAGVRPTFGKLALDLGVWYYAYPGGQEFGPTAIAVAPALANGNTIKGRLDFWEVFGKATLAVHDNLSLGAFAAYTPSWLNSGADGLWASANFKVTVPSAALPTGLGAYWSGEVGYYWLGTTDAFYGVPAFPNGINLPDYADWNLGFGLSWKVFTIDFRYYDTDATKEECNVLTGDHTAVFGGVGSITNVNVTGNRSNWCNATFIVKLSADISVKDHLK
jgi:uncharacterized protein (TIGR02001 family)